MSERLSVTVPCRGCKERAVGCHATCEKYEKYKENSEIIKERKRRNGYL